MVRDPFDDFYRRMMKQFFKDLEELEESLGDLGEPRKRLPEFVVRRPGGVEKKSGFKISISSNGKNPPKVEMKRFGPGGKWEKVPLKKGGIPRVPEPAQPKPKAAEEKPTLPEVKEKVIPEYNVSVDINEVTITLNAEGVESEDNVRINFYPESVEVYAVSPKRDKGYFCTVTIPTSVNKRGAKIDVKKDQVIIKIPRHISST